MAAQIRLLFLLVASILLAVGSAHPSLEVSNNNKTVSVNINKLFDMMLPKLHNIILNDGMDPLSMSDIYKKLDGVITHNGVLDMTNGRLLGLANIKRGGDVILSFENKVLAMNMNLRFDALDLEYDYFFRYGLIHRQGNFYGYFTNMDMSTTLLLDMVNYKIVIDSIKIINIENLSIKLKGNVFDNVLNTAIKYLVNVFKQKVVDTVEQRCWNTFHKIIDSINAKIPRPDNQLEQYGVHDIFENVPTTFTFDLA